MAKVGKVSKMICWRCGVDFDPTPFKNGAPCIDCQPEVEGTWVQKTGRRGRLSMAEMAERDAKLVAANAAGMTDPEIARILDYKDRTSVWQARKRLGIPAVHKPEKYLWADKDAQVEHARKIGRENTNHKRGKKIDKGRVGFNG